MRGEKALVRNDEEPLAQPIPPLIMPLRLAARKQMGRFLPGLSLAGTPLSVQALRLPLPRGSATIAKLLLPGGKIKAVSEGRTHSNSKSDTPLVVQPAECIRAKNCNRLPAFGMPTVRGEWHHNSHTGGAHLGHNLPDAQVRNEGVSLVSWCQWYLRSGNSTSRRKEWFKSAAVGQPSADWARS